MLSSNNRQCLVLLENRIRDASSARSALAATASPRDRPGHIYMYHRGVWRCSTLRASSLNVWYF